MNPLISVIIPSYNEGKTIIKILEKIAVIDLDKNIIVVDDGSSDNTWELLNSFSKKTSLNLKLIRHQKNLGKGAAIQTGLKQATGEIIIIQDADLEYDPSDYQKLIAPILSNQAEVVYGSRNMGQGRSGKMIYKWGGIIITIVADLLYGLKLTDEATGYKIFKKGILESLKLESTGFEFCPEVTAKIARKGYRLVELPILYNPRSHQEGKKIKFKDGLIAIWTLIKYRFKKLN